MGMNQFFKGLNKLERMIRCPGEFMFEQHNVASHSFKVAQYCQVLGMVEEQHGVTIDWRSLYEKALNHDYPEIFIGDIKTPVKYASPAMRAMIQQVEEGMTEAFVEAEIPLDFQEIFREKLKEGKDGTTEGLILAVADKMDQVYEAFEEIQRGNTEDVYVSIYTNALIAIRKIDLHCVDYFLNVILGEMLDEKTNAHVDIRQITEEVLSSEKRHSLRIE